MPENALGQAIGEPLPNWQPLARPARIVHQGRYCRLEPLSASTHAEALFAAASLETSGSAWTYLPYGPFATAEAYGTWLSIQERLSDPLFFTIVDVMSKQPVGVCAYLRIDEAAGSIEVGHLYFSPLLQRTPAATEAMYLLMKHAFELGYRRYEWKCDALNAASRRAAQRFGFSFEGVFRQARVIKGRNRDTAWFSIIDGEWPALQAAFAQWLAPGNFSAEGKQKVSLSSLTGPLLQTLDPDAA